MSQVYMLQVTEMRLSIKVRDGICTTAVYHSKMLFDAMKMADEQQERNLFCTHAKETYFVPMLWSMDEEIVRDSAVSSGRKYSGIVR